MTLTREDPRPLAPQVRSATLRAVALAVVSVAVYWVVTTYADDAVRFLRSLGLRQRDIQPWQLPAMAVLIAIPVWHVLSALLQLARVTGRYLTARRWERQLDDPARAADVPPLGSHLITGTRVSVATAIGAMVGAVLLTLGSFGFAVGAAFNRLPFQASDDAIGYAWLLAVSGCWAIYRSSKGLAVARRAAKVERLSSSGPAEVALSAGARAAQVPTLHIEFASPLRPAPGRGSVGRILYLRLFDNLAGTNRFVERWRRHGVVHYLRSADQVSADELKTWSGRVGDLSVFIDNDAELDEFLAASQPVEGPDGYPAGELLCHGSYWKRAVQRLLTEVDHVVLDLTGFTADHGGTAFEVRSAFDLVDVARLKLTASHSSDTRFLNAQLQHAWSQLAADSPNAGTGVREVTVYVG